MEVPTDDQPIETGARARPGGPVELSPPDSVESLPGSELAAEMEAIVDGTSDRPDDFQIEVLREFWNRIDG